MPHDSQVGKTRGRLAEKLYRGGPGTGFPVGPNAAGLTIGIRGPVFRRRCRRYTGRMRYFIPRLQYGAFSPSQTALQDKFGGFPWGLPASRWPICSSCGEPQTLIAQLVHDDQWLDLGRKGRVLHVFQCQHWLENGCSPWEPSSRANDCFVLESQDMADGPTTPPPNTVVSPESRVTDWVAQEDGVNPETAPAFFDESAWLALDEETLPIVAQAVAACLSSPRRTGRFTGQRPFRDPLPYNAFPANQNDEVIC